MKKILLSLILILCFCCSCNRYVPGDMYISSIEGPYSNNMCSYSVDGSYSWESVVIQDSCGKYTVGDKLYIHK